MLQPKLLDKPVVTRKKIVRRKKQKKLKKIKVLIGYLAILGFLGSTIFFVDRQVSYEKKQGISISYKKSLSKSKILSLLALSPQERRSSLENIIDRKNNLQENNLSFDDRNRALYLLAIDSIQRKKLEPALNYLQGLDKQYSLLAPYILLEQAKIYRKTNRQDLVKSVVKSIISNYPDSTIVPDALALLNKNNSQAIKKLFTDFPYHPETQNLARKIIKENPEQWQLLLLLTKYGHGSDLNQIRDLLVLKYPSKLKQEDWKVIADGYWHEKEYRKAADAYRFSPSTPDNLYRSARGFHRNGNYGSAKRAYLRLIDRYHDARESGLALLYLARISVGREALAYLDMAIQKFPSLIPNALLSKARIYNAISQTERANDFINEALQNFPDSSSVLQYRWSQAQKFAELGDFESAIDRGKAIVESNSSYNNPKAIFWLGKWARHSGNKTLADRAFKKVIKAHPQSYYAWRSAVMLGWNVGDFQSLRDRLFLDSGDRLHNIPLKTAPYLPMGSDTLQELFFLGQYKNAWLQFQSEVANSRQLNVPEQFTKGLLLVKLGQTRSGIQEIFNLAERESPQDKEQWQSLRQNPSYWYALFPTPYIEDILSNSQKYKINPFLVLSLMRKESTFDPLVDSPVGALGLMQLMPKTAKWASERIDFPEYNLTKSEDNIKIGTWYLAHNHERYNNNSLLAIASYNAGTGNINQWLSKEDLTDPDLFVEKIPYPETKDYVEGVFGNYWNYLRLYDPQIQQLMKDDL